MKTEQEKRICDRSMVNSKKNWVSTSFKPELLAPAGREDVFHAVLEAGADAVYMSGKLFNMRRHRSDYHFTGQQVEKLVNLAHENGKKVYITVNSLIAQGEIPALRDYLKYLDDIAADAVITQDFSVVKLHADNNLTIPLHSSTMMNVNSVDYASFLKSNGFTRVVTSRDITVDEVRRIGEEAEIETEYFLHGDMCSVQSGQCYGSGVIFGKSSNRGQCMKLCRWAYDMVAESSGEKVAEGVYLLATKDLCLLEQIPELVNSGIASLKIEGRMKAPEQLFRIVSLYRRAIDRYCLAPLSYNRNAEDVLETHRNRVRSISTGFAFKTPGVEYFDLAGDREPMFLSYSGKQSAIKEWDNDLFAEVASDHAPDKRLPSVTCVVGNVETGLSALKNGADDLILSWEGSLRADSGWSEDDLNVLLDAVSTNSEHASGQLVFELPKIVMERELRELEFLLKRSPSIETFSITTPGAIPLLKDFGRKIWVAYNCNVLNAEACEFFQGYGVERVNPSLESSFANIKEMMAVSPRTHFELSAHGPLTSMLVEHCLIAMNTAKISKKEFCSMPCLFDDFSLIDKRGAKRVIHADRYCRNHIMLEMDLCVLPILKSLLALKPGSIRIDARLNSPDDTGFIVKSYSDAIRKPERLQNVIDSFLEKFSERDFSLGAYPKGIAKDKDISLLDLKIQEMNDDSPHKETCIQGKGGAE